MSKRQRQGPLDRVDKEFGTLQAAMEASGAYNFTTQEKKKLLAMIEASLMGDCSSCCEKDPKSPHTEQAAADWTWLHVLRCKLLEFVPVGFEVAKESAHHVVDAFLYDDDAVDALCDAGLVARSKCTQCGSTDIVDVDFVSHSFNFEQLEYLFEVLLAGRITANTQIVDVGSRMGVVPLVAARYTKSTKIVGLELDSAMCNLQRKLVTALNMDDRVTTAELDCASEEGLKILAASDIIILNNVFECFVSEQEERKIWKALQRTITRPGQVVVTYPPLAATAARIKLHDLARGPWVEITPSVSVDAFLSKRQEHPDDAGSDCSAGADANLLEDMRIYWVPQPVAK